MPFVLRTTELPPLNRLLELEQIVLVDKTGPSIPFGPANGASCLVAEWLKGPFLPREVTSTADIIRTFGGVSNLMSQSAAGVADGSGARYEGNGAVNLIGKQFSRLVIQRVNTDMTTTDGGATKAYVKFSVSIAAADQDPFDATKTGKDITVPAGTRFADAAVGVATAIVALSQDVIIPKGSTITSNKVAIAFNLKQDTDGFLTLETDTAKVTTGATAFFVKGTTLASGATDTPIDTAIPGVASTISVTGGDTDLIVAAGTATAAFAAGTAAAALDAKNESLYAVAINKTRPTASPGDEITSIWSARRGTVAANIRNVLVQNAIDSSNEGRGRIALVSGPRGGTVTGDATSAADGLARVFGTGAYVGTGTIDENPGSGVENADRRVITFPYYYVYSLDLQKNVLVPPSGLMAVTFSQFPEEKNPGARNPYIQSVVGLDDIYANAPWERQDYVNFKSKGIAALKRDKTVGWWFQSGVTSANPQLLPTRAPIKRRRMADFVQDGLNGIGAKYNKEPATEDRIDAMVGEVDAFLSGLSSPVNPSAQRIEGYFIDDKNGNTDQLRGLGIFTLLVEVRLLASLDTIVFQTTIGETVDLQEAA